MVDKVHERRESVWFGSAFLLSMMSSKNAMKMEENASATRERTKEWYIIESSKVPIHTPSLLAFNRTANSAPNATVDSFCMAFQLQI
ncbi:hypothetical protein AMATHDRAFT_66431 [Amanita thiersii Skay4041]|uniref:Uncharacterized protein n=1 Tax=Amanita thiersii Skay4041 TaxID=703135 RepID=A0A2A9NJX2_9AGAR|nr:hypothetical protein AMATHDRAFT_66431 [Amanita thiersii Skay4041]